VGLRVGELSTGIIILSLDLVFKLYSTMAIPLLAVFPLILSEEDSTADDELDCEDESRGVA